jgi:flavin-dependent dehydrogenase
MTDDQTNFDVIIVGGGPAGCATALSLLNRSPGYETSVLLVDDADPTSFKIGESLPADAKQILARLSPHLAARLVDGMSDGTHARCTGNAFAWATPDVEEKHAILNPYGMGWHLDRARFDETLREAVTQGPSTIAKGVFTAVEWTDGVYGWRVSVRALGLDNTTVYHSKVVVDASGRKACLARKLGARTVKTDSLLAFYALFQATHTTQDHDYRTLIEATESGWWYTSQLPNSCRVVVYHTDDSDPTSRIARKEEGFLNLLQSETTHISQLIAEMADDLVVDPGARQPKCTAAGSSYLEPCYDSGDDGESGSPKWYAVGDAAMAFDPLSSQGMIMALKMGYVVGEAIAQQLCAGPGRQDAHARVADTYGLVRDKYEREKRMCYVRVGRFDAEFWRRRRETSSNPRSDTIFH